MQPLVKVKLLDKEAKIPTYATDGDAGADIYSLEDITLWSGERKLVRTGIAIELPKGYEAQIRPRSGLALKNGVTVLNTPGTIDQLYRGEVKVILYNTGSTDAPSVDLPAGSKIAQMVIKPVEQAIFSEAKRLSSTSRGENGFGSTGK